jgi:hypothetical protein
MVVWPELMEGTLGDMGLIVIKTAGFHQETVDWLMVQDIPVLLDDVWYVRGEAIKRAV